MSTAAAPRRFRFGPYELDARTGELRNGGIRLRVGSHASQILMMLLEQAGEAVFREAIQARLWPDDTVVEFDAGINTAVRQLRAALNDSAENPKYIETVSRRGYRFLARVEPLGSAAPAMQAPLEMVPAAAKVDAALAWRYAVAAVLVTIFVGILWWRLSPVTPLTDQDVLVLADFANTTGDAAFDGSLRQALAFELEQSPFLKVMDDQTVNQALTLMGRPHGQEITYEIAQEVCVREARKATISGAIASLGPSYQVSLQATNCHTGATLAREQAEAKDKQHIPEAVANAAARMRAKLGEPLVTIQRIARSRLDVTTPSLEALKAFQRGQALNSQGLSREAIPYFQHAVDLDPNFASAYMFLAVVYGNTGQGGPMREAGTKAFSLIDRVSERERLFISGFYYRSVTLEMDKAVAALEMLVRSYPRFVGGHHLLGTTYVMRGEYEKALPHRVENALIEPKDVMFQQTLIQDYIYLDRFSEAKAAAQRAFSEKLTDPTLHQPLLQMAYIEDDRVAQERVLQWLASHDGEYQSLNEQLIDALVHGHRRKAWDILRRAYEVRRRLGIPGQTSDVKALDWSFGDCEVASGGPPPIVCMDVPALRLAEERNTRKPPPNPDVSGFIFQRGRLALATGEAQKAVREFQKILGHKGRFWGPLYAPAHLFLARADAAAGQPLKATKPTRTSWRFGKMRIRTFHI
ncbi:MAG: winged helix-turn-helix domain-containing protein [Acidobacteriota bacterium]